MLTSGKTPTPQRFPARGESRSHRGRSPIGPPRTVMTDSTAPRTSQFNSTPRFTFQSSTDCQSSVRPLAFTVPPRPTQPQTRRNDDIDDFDSQEVFASVANDDGDEDMLDESPGEPIDAQPDAESPTSKRARISVESDVSDVDDTDNPRAPRTVSPSLRFRFRPPRVDDGGPPGSAHARPAFILPDSPEERQKIELPAIFSPHRKSQRFVPGGLADSMRTNIMEAFSEQHRGQNQASHGEERLTVAACRSTSQASLIQGVSDSGSEEHVMLIGQKRRPAVGDMILLQGASWEVELQERTWAVYLEWKIE